nr:MAG TPA: hypothetical protein [Caudoviricetes sp.]
MSRKYCMAKAIKKHLIKHKNPLVQKTYCPP